MQSPTQRAGPPPQEPGPTISRHQATDPGQPNPADVPAAPAPQLRLFAEVHRLVSKAIELAGGSVPPVGSVAWWSAPDAAKAAGLLVLAESRLLDDPHHLAAEQLRGVSIAISGALDWRAFARDHVPHTELQRRRSELGPHHQPYTGGPVAWDTSTQETAA